MDSVTLSPGIGYQIANPPLIRMEGEDAPHQLGRYITVLSATDDGIHVYDGSYGGGFASVFLASEAVATLELTPLEKTDASILDALVQALEHSTASANERRGQLVEAGQDAGTAMAEAKVYFASYLSGQIKGLAAKGLINPNIAVHLTSLSTGIDLD